MDYPCLSSLVISVSAVWVLTRGQTDRHRERERERESQTDAAKRFTPATVVCMFE